MEQPQDPHARDLAALEEMFGPRAAADTAVMSTLKHVLDRSAYFPYLFAQAPRIAFVMDGMSLLMRCDPAQGKLSLRADADMSTAEVTVTTTVDHVRALDAGKPSDGPLSVEFTQDASVRRSRLARLVLLCMRPERLPLTGAEDRDDLVLGSLLDFAADPEEMWQAGGVQVMRWALGRREVCTTSGLPECELVLDEVSSTPEDAARKRETFLRSVQDVVGGRATASSLGARAPRELPEEIPAQGRMVRLAQIYLSGETPAGPLSGSAKPAGIAVLVFLFFAFLWLAIAAAGLSGVQLAQGATASCLVQGMLSLGAALLLAARLQIAPVAAAVAVVLILICPSMLGGIEQRIASWSGARAANEALVSKLSLPPWERPTELNPQMLAAEGWVEGPAIDRLARVRRENFELWLTAHPNSVYNIRADLYNRFRRNELKPVTTGDPVFNQRLVSDLGKSQGGEDWVWFDSFLKSARAEGLDDPPKMTSDDAKNAHEHARAWLGSHPGAFDPTRHMAPGDRMQMEAETAPRGGGASLFAIFLFGAVAAAFMARPAFHRPFEIAMVPTWIKQGLAAHLRPDGTSALRLGVGFALVGLGAVAMILIIATRTRGLSKVAAMLVLLGGAAVASALTLPDEVS